MWISEHTEWGSLTSSWLSQTLQSSIGLQYCSYGIRTFTCFLGHSLFDVLCFPMQSLLHLTKGHLPLISVGKNSPKCWMSQYSYFSFIRNHLLTKWRTWVSLFSLELGCCYTMFCLESVWSVRNTTFSLLCLLFPFHLASFSIIYWLFIYCRLISNPGPCASYASAPPPS